MKTSNQTANKKRRVLGSSGFLRRNLLFVSGLAALVTCPLQVVAETSKCPDGFVDTVVPGVGDSCTGYCGTGCWMVGFALDFGSTIGMESISGSSVGDGLEKQAREEALNQCEGDLATAYAAKAVECATICGSSDPQCDAQFEPADYVPCSASCSQSHVNCYNPLDLVLDGGNNRADCDAGGAFVVRCNCLPRNIAAQQNELPAEY